MKKILSALAIAVTMLSMSGCSHQTVPQGTIKVTP